MSKLQHTLECIARKARGVGGCWCHLPEIQARLRASATGSHSVAVLPAAANVELAAEARERVFR